MKKTMLTLTTAALFSLISTSAFTGTIPQRIDPLVQKYDLSLEKGMIDYTGSGENTKKVIEFIIKNKTIISAPATTIVFKRGKQTTRAKVPALKGRKQTKVRFTCDYDHGAMNFSTAILLRDANLRNNVVRGTE